MIDFKLPSLGADMDAGALVAWLVQPGDSIERGQIVAEVETDKGIIEVECWEDAVVDELLVEPSDARLAVGTSIARFRSPSEVVTPAAVSDAGERDATGIDATGSDRDAQEVGGDAVAATPPVRHLAHELGVELDVVTATGHNGQVTRDDIRRTAAAVAAPASSPTTELRPQAGAVPSTDARSKASPRARRMAAERGVDLASVPATRADGLLTVADLPQSSAPLHRSEPPSGRSDDPSAKAEAMRRAIARQMQRSKREIPHYYLSDEIDLSVPLSWLEVVNEERPVTARILPAVLLLKATAVALKRVPGLNGHWTDDGFIQGDAVHLGVAVSLRGGGLVAPAIHDADGKALPELMAALSDLVARARSGRLRGSEMTDPTSTVTNLGDRGVAATFPVIIPPQVSIIGFGKVAERPVAIDGHVIVHPTATVSLAADHRVTDGHTGGLLLRAIDRLLQEPETL